MSFDPAAIEQILKRDPVWSAYALADLEAEHRPYCTWLQAGQSLLLIYRALEPPVLFIQGAPDEIDSLVLDVPAGRYQLSCRPEHLIALQDKIRTESISKMWRMAYTGSVERIQEKAITVLRLNQENLPGIQELFAGHSDAPDAFLSSQLQSGIFYGVFDQKRLIAISGTHVHSPRFRLAAIGNVFTHPDYRGLGFASLTTRAVVDDLLTQGTETIVLNVVQSNQAAIKAYERIGFQVHCEYVEGYGIRFKR
jgi:ribosomal protein S18 acetylase RimI-like enzyme